VLSSGEVHLAMFALATDIFGEAAQAASDIAASAARDIKAVRDYLTLWSWNFALSSTPARKEAARVLLEWLQLLDKQTELASAAAALAPGLSGALSGAAAELRALALQFGAWGGGSFDRIEEFYYNIVNTGTLAYQR
jgi:hypothetical protein